MLIFLLAMQVAAAMPDGGDDGREDLLNFLVELGHEKKLASDVTDHICKLTDDPVQRRLSATHYLQLWHPESVGPEPANIPPAKGPSALALAQAHAKNGDEWESPMCIDHIGCQDISEVGDYCCPMVDGTRNGCCDFIPPVPELKPPMPHLDTPASTGFLGPIQNVQCIDAQAETVTASSPEDCQAKCDAGCRAVNWDQAISQCEIVKNECSSYVKKPDAVTFVRNIWGITDREMPPINIKGSRAHIFVLGDWGSLSCPGRASMHYVKHFKRYKGDPEWEVDHEAQPSVAKTMLDVADKNLPVAVLNIGDAFYWGGIFHWKIGGEGVLDNNWKVAFEDVYNRSSLMVPWLGVMGNHDYGGDGCFGDYEAFIHYTYKELSEGKHRWKMPSLYFKQTINFSNFDIDTFAIDTNWEDSHFGRHGGICRQELCVKYYGVSEPTGDVEWCKAWFTKMDKEIWAWLETALAKSTAHWKVLFGHHRPRGMYGFHVEPMLLKYNVQVVIGGHTHETGFHARYLKDADPPNTHTALIMHGMGGGAIGNPGCGGMDFCGLSQDYGFIDTQWTKYSMTTWFYHFDGRVLYTATINSLGMDGGEWVISDWGPCDGSQRKRSVLCSEGADNLCPYMARPITQEACSGYQTWAPTTHAPGSPTPTPTQPTMPPTPPPTTEPPTPAGQTDPPTPEGGVPTTQYTPAPTAAGAEGAEGGGGSGMLLGGLAVVVGIALAGVLFVKFGGGGAATAAAAAQPEQEMANVRAGNA